jgi:parvulin-like peptidyl-prolyl isomerase
MRAPAAPVSALALLSPLLLLAGAGCGDAVPERADAVARVDDRLLLREEFDGFLDRNLGADASQAQSAALSSLFDEFLDEELLVRLAVERGVVPAGVRGRRVVDRLLAVSPPSEPTEAEVAAYYQAHLEEFHRPERVHLRQILVEDRATAERLHRELRAGADFVELARRYSRDPTGEVGGDQGELSREDLPPSLVEMVFALESGETSEVIPVPYGYHLFEVMERFEEALVPLEAVYPEILARLRTEANDRRVAEWVQEARDRYNVRIYERNLPFAYRGIYRETP